jgi:hypothetical protein
MDKQAEERLTKAAVDVVSTSIFEQKAGFVMLDGMLGAIGAIGDRIIISIPLSEFMTADYVKSIQKRYRPVR